MNSMMKSVVIILCSLDAINSLKEISPGNLKNAIKELLKSDNSVPHVCVDQLKFLADSLNNKKPWAKDSELKSRCSSIHCNYKLSVINSWSPVDHGKSYDYRDFDKCINVHHESKQHGTISGQHCIFQVKSKSNKTVFQRRKRSFLIYGWKKLTKRRGGAICVPKKCSPEVVKKLIQNMMNGSEYKVASDYDQSYFCKTSKSSYSRNFVIICCIFVAFLLFSTFCTVYDFATRNFTARNQWLLSFSVSKNAFSLLDVNRKQSADALKFLHCIRFVPAFSIVWGHTCFHRSLFPLQHSENFSRLLYSNMGKFKTALNFSVDTFFVVSGLLVTRSTLKALDA